MNPPVPALHDDDAIRQLARTVLYEGYLLYPYRLSSVKNRHRWNFGVLFPRAYCQQADNGETSFLQTECLIEGTPDTHVTAEVRFLQLNPDGVSTTEQLIPMDRRSLASLCGPSEPVTYANGSVTGKAGFRAHKIDERTFKLTLRVSNETGFTGGNRDDALRAAFLSTHALMHVTDGFFPSLIDPPAALKTASEQCRNIGAWPVLVGRTGQRSHMFAAPIILYDYPRIAPQSPGDLFDNTEIDEILALRVRTLTDAEKDEVRRTDERARNLLEQTDALDPVRLAALHGTTRGAPPKSPLRQGDQVRLLPKRRADILDLALAGRIATVCSVEADVEGNSYVCVTIDDDPGRDLGLEGKPGHRFFFGPDEVEKL